MNAVNKFAHKAESPAAERLASARAGLGAAERHIAELETRRRAALLADDDRAAAKADRDLIAARLLAKRLVDKIDLLGQQMQTDNALPNDAPAARTLIANLEQRQRALTARKKLDRSATDDTEIDQLGVRIPALRQRLEIPERML
jgi:hypothetical protein